MDVLTDDHEREQAVRRWWHDNWKPLLAGVAIALLVIAGYKQYQAWDLERAQSLAYEVYRLQQDLGRSASGSAERAQSFMEGHHDLYGALVAMELAGYCLTASDYPAALDALSFVREYGGEFIAPLAMLLEARVQASGGEYERAQASLQAVTQSSYLVEKLELSGDIYMQQGDRAAAHDAYREALQASRARDAVPSPLLEMKFNSVIQSQDHDLASVDGAVPAAAPQ